MTTRTARALIAGGLALTIVALWLWGPLRALLDIDQASALAAPLRAHWWGPPVAVVGTAIGILSFLPMTPLVVVVVLLFGPAEGFAVSLLGVVLAACLGHTIGRFLLRDALKRRLTRWAPYVAAQLEYHDLRATLVMRMMPFPPFAVMNMLAGSAGVRLGYFTLGSLIGVSPVLALIAWASAGVLEALREPRPEHLIQAGAALVVVVLAVGTIHWLRKRWVRRYAERGARPR